MEQGLNEALALYHASVRKGPRLMMEAVPVDSNRGVTSRGNSPYDKFASPATRAKVLEARLQEIEAFARNRGIPTRLGYADVRNHLTSDKLREGMGTDLFVYHGYTELFLEGRWLKATPTFNRELCERFDVTALEFDGASDALMQEFDGRGRRHMEYVRYHGIFNDFPYEDMVAAWYEAYPEMMAAAGNDSSNDKTFARTSSDD